MRDPDWATIPGVVSDLHVERRPTSFSASFVVDHRAGPIDYTWRGRIDGADDGTITYHMDGTANAPFAYNRIGFCVLHPDDECAGQAYSGRRSRRPDQRTAAGSHRAAAVRERASTCRSSRPFSSLTIDLRSGGHAAPRAASATSSRPRTSATGPTRRTSRTARRWRSGSPIAPRPGSASGSRSACAAAGQDTTAGRRRARGSCHAAHRRPAPVAACRPSGSGRQRRRRRPTTRRCELLRALRPAHQRVDVHLDDPTVAVARTSRLSHGSERWVAPSSWRSSPVRTTTSPRWPSASPDCRSPECWSSPPGPRRRRQRRRRLRTWYAGRPSELAPAARRHAGRRRHGHVLLRAQPHPSGRHGDGVHRLSIMPQEHATDELTLVENLSAQAETVRSAQRFAGGRPIVISPVTLLPRWPAPDGGSPPGVPAHRGVDGRQRQVPRRRRCRGGELLRARPGRGGVVTEQRPRPPRPTTSLRWAIDHAGAPVRECTSYRSRCGASVWRSATSRARGGARGQPHAERTECRLAEVADVTMSASDRTPS